MYYFWKHFQTRVASILSMKSSFLCHGDRKPSQLWSRCKVQYSSWINQPQTNQPNKPLGGTGTMHYVWNPTFPGGLHLVTVLFLRLTKVCQRGSVHTDRIQLLDSHIFSKHFSADSSMTLFYFPAFLDFLFQLVVFCLVCLFCFWFCFFYVPKSNNTPT